MKIMFLEDITEVSYLKSIRYFHHNSSKITSLICSLLFNLNFRKYIISLVCLYKHFDYLNTEFLFESGKNTKNNYTTSDKKFEQTGAKQK